MLLGLVAMTVNDELISKIPTPMEWSFLPLKHNTSLIFSTWVNYFDILLINHLLDLSCTKRKQGNIKTPKVGSVKGPFTFVMKIMQH